MKKLLLVLVILGLAGLGVYIGVQRKNQVFTGEKPVVKIGLIAPLTGDNAEVANNVRDVMQLYLKENSENYRVQYELAVEDDAFGVKNSVAAADKLIDDEKVEAMVSTLTYAGLAVAPLAKEAKIAHINLGANPVVADGQYNFVNLVSPKELTDMVFRQFSDEGVKEFALVYMNDAGADAYVKEIKDYVDNKSDLNYKEYPFNAGEKDFRLMLAGIKKNNPGMIVLFALPPSLDIIGRQIKQQGVNIPITSIGFLNMSNDKTLFEGQVFVDVKDGSDDFVQKVKKELKTDNLFLLAFAWDAIKAYVDCVERFFYDNGRVPTRQELAEMIRDFKEFDGIAKSGGVYKKIENGKVVVAGGDAI